MSTGLKIFLWILAIIAFLALVVYVVIIPWGKGVWDKISFSTPKLQTLDLKGLTLDDLKKLALSGGSKDVTVTLGMDIKNDNNFSIQFSTLKVEIYYKGTLIAKTEDNTWHTIPGNSIYPFSSIVNITLNGAGLQMILEKAITGKTSVDFKTDIRVYGIPVPTIETNLSW